MSKKILLASVLSTVALGAMSQDASASSIRELVVGGVPAMARTVSVASPLARIMVQPTYKSNPSRMITSILHRNFSTEANKTEELARILTNVGPSNDQLKKISDELTLLRASEENNKKAAGKHARILYGFLGGWFAATGLVAYDGVCNNGENLSRFVVWVAK